MIVAGLTGGIASGKSTVSNIIAAMDIPVIDADKISRTIVGKGSKVLKTIKDYFGAEVINCDGTLNRKYLSNIVFEDKNKLQKLNSITHPEIKKIIKKDIVKYDNAGKSLCVVDAALLIEAKYLDIVNYVLLVYTDEKTQLERLIKRDNLSIENAIRKIKSQMPFEEKKKYADYIIDNNRDLEYTKLQVNKIVGEILFMEDMHDKKKI